MIKLDENTWVKKAEIAQVFAVDDSPLCSLVILKDGTNIYSDRLAHEIIKEVNEGPNLLLG